jgi:hypothetical protein
MTWTICHNDDDYRDEWHRRVTLTVVPSADDRWVISADGEPTDYRFGSADEAQAAIAQLWQGECWDLRAEDAP